MMITALALAAGLLGAPQTAQPASQQVNWTPDRIREGCGYLPGSTALIPIEVGVFNNSDPPFLQGRLAVRVNGQWSHPGQAPYLQARSRDWYVESEPITVRGRNYVKYGLPRILSRDEVTWFADLDGLAVTADPAQTEPTVVYLLSDPVECEFQPYQQQW